MTERAGPPRGAAHAPGMREAVLRALEEGREPMQQIARRLGVSVSYVCRLGRRQGAPCGAASRGRPAALGAQAREFLLEFAKEARGSRLAVAEAAAAALLEQGVAVSVSTVRREYARHGLPERKNGAGEPSHRDSPSPDPGGAACGPAAAPRRRPPPQPVGRP